MGNRHLDWLRQGEADLRHARHSLESRDFEWSCFASQQAAEKGLKAVFLKLGLEAWGHTLTALLGRLPTTVSVPEPLQIYCRILDKHYIPTRYPNGFDSGAPVDFYTEPEARQAIEYAEAILAFCRGEVD